MIKLNLGSGTHYKEGYVNIDIDTTNKVDIVYNLEDGIPAQDNSVDEIYSSNFMEHIPNIEYTFSEMIRVGKKGCKIIMIVPHFSSCSNHYYQHVRSFRAIDAWEIEKKGFRVVDVKIELGLPFKLLSPIVNLSSRILKIYEHFNILNTLFPAARISYTFEVQK